MGHGHGDSVMLSEESTLLASFPLNWLETTILIVAWTALVVDVMRQQWISQVSKIAWIVFIILVPIVSWIAYGIVRHRHGVGPASHT